MTDHLDYNATRNVGDIVRIGGPYFGSLARVTAFYANAEPTLIDFVITEPSEAHIHEGETGQAIAGRTELA